MPCPPFLCGAAADCGDLNCPGHPDGAAAYLDKQDREALAHHANTQAGSLWPKAKDAQITVERISLLSPQERSAFDCIDRWGFPIAVAAVVAIVIALLVVLNWPHLSRWLAS